MVAGFQKLSEKIMFDGLTHKTPGRSGTYPEMRGKEDCGISAASM
jgi:hypothetical protein